MNNMTKVYIRYTELNILNKTYGGKFNPDANSRGWNHWSLVFTSDDDNTPEEERWTFKVELGTGFSWKGMSVIIKPKITHDPAKVNGKDGEWVSGVSFTKDQILRFVEDHPLNNHDYCPWNFNCQLYVVILLIQIGLGVNNLNLKGFRFGALQKFIDYTTKNTVKRVTADSFFWNNLTVYDSYNNKEVFKYW